MKLSACLLFTISVVIAGVLCDDDCQEVRKKALKSNSEGKIIPKCTKDGQFQDLQCVQGSANCTCYRPDGTQIMEPRPKLRTCDCINHKDKVSGHDGRRLVGAYRPQCEEDGSYKKTQCNGSIGSCWCVDEKGKKNGKSLDEC